MLYTTTVTVRRPADPADPYDATPDSTLIAAGVRAHIGQETGSRVNSGTEQETVSWRLDCDLVDIIHGDLVTDDKTGAVFTVSWARPRQGLGLDHVEASLQQVSQRSPL